MTVPASPTPYGNPFLVAPESMSAGPIVTGGGADGYIDHVVALMLDRVNPRPITISAVPVTPGARVFDLAELVARSAQAAGVPGILPDRTDLLRSYCWGARSTLNNPTIGLGLKGALMFGPEGLGLSLGSRGRVIVYDLTEGVVVDARLRTWTEAALIPNARGYR